MKKQLLLFAFSVGSLYTFAQNFGWVKNMGGPNYDIGYSIALDASGNIYTAGSFQGTADFDPSAATYTLTAAGTYGVFVSKLDAAGNFLWAKLVGGASTDPLPAIALDQSGNVFLTSASQAVTTGTTSMSSTGGTDVFVSKIDPLGTIAWTKNMGGFYDDRGSSINVDASGNIYTTGYYNGTPDFDPGAASYTLATAGLGSSNIFVSKLNASGNFVWAKGITGNNNNIGLSIVSDGSGNVYSTGFYGGYADFDPSAATYTVNSAGSYDIFILKLDAAGNFAWVKSIGGSAGDQANAIALDASGNVYTAGSFEQTVDFDPGAATYTLSSYTTTDDIFVSKLDAAGNFVWAKKMGGTGGESAKAITIDHLGNVYTTGSYNGSADFDPGPASFPSTSNSSEDIFISKLDASGNFADAKTLGGPNNFDSGNSIAVDASGNVFTTGSFQGTVDFDPGVGTFTLTSAAIDAFVLKLGMLQSTGIQTLSDQGSLKLYPNPNTGVFTVELKSAARLTVVDALGKIVLDEYKEEGNQTINLSNISNGIYFITITDKATRYTAKMMKE